MCGIAGIVDFRGGVSEALVRRMSESIQHRGPDGSGFTGNASRTVALAHRRLSIIDLSEGGAQPMVSADRRFILVFNGEIYNYRELRKELETAGRTFASHSDTEVLLRLWEAEGKECLGKLRGMFAFAIWDESAKSLTMARDPYGIKPLFYRIEAGTLFFASELKAFKAAGLAKETEPEAIGAYVQWGSIPAPLTFYAGIRALPQGSTLTFSEKESRPEPVRFWDYGKRVFPEGGERRRIRTRRDAVAHVREALLDSIRKHLVSDVPVGAFLSGGIDSTGVVSLMRQAGQDSISTFSIGSERAGLDESPYARLAAKTYGTTHHEWRVTARDFLSCRGEILAALDQPTVDGVNTWFVSRFAHEKGCKVVTSGAGGDEFFYGYDGTFGTLPTAMAALRHLPGFLAKPLAAGLRPWGQRFPAAAKAASMLGAAGNPARQYDVFRGLFAPSAAAGLLAHRGEGERAGAVRMETMLPGGFPPDAAASSAGRRRIIKVFEASRYLGCQLLPDADIFSMRHSLELRLPLVDRGITEALEEIEDECFEDGRGGPKKSLLIEAVGDIPKELVHRKKQGFTLPIGDWMREYSWRPESGKLSEPACAQVDAAFRAGKLHWSRRWALEALDHVLARN